MKRNIFSRFLKNQDATAEIVGTLLLIIILIFFFGNVFLWSNEVNKISDQIKWDKMNSPIRIDPIYQGTSEIFSHFEVTNLGGVDASLSRLWILNSSNTGDENDHIFADLEPLEVWVSAGKKRLITLSSLNIINPNGSLNATLSSSEIIINYKPPAGFPLSFKILTNTGNTAACSIQSESFIGLSNLPIVSSEYVLPWTGLGADYLMYYSNGDPSLWTNSEFIHNDVTYYGHVDLVNYWKPLFHQAKLGFTFNGVNQSCSYYEYNKMSQVIQLFADRGVGVIPALYPSWDAEDYCGSPQLTSDWVDFTYDFLDDDRILAFNLYGEPVGGIDGGQGTNTISWYDGIQSRKDLALYFVDLVEAIHSIDPDRVVIYPYLGLSYWNQYELIADLEGSGIFDEPNVLFDIIHPYYFERPDWNEGTPAEKAVMYKNQFIVPWINRLPSSKLVCGETFCFAAPVQENNFVAPNRELQVEFMTNMINVFVEHKIGFNFWASLTFPPNYVSPNQVFSRSNAHIESILASDYGTLEV